MEPLIHELKKLNLSEKEARVYLALLELGPSTPYKIAKKAHLKRPTAYVIAEGLAEKGLIIQVTGEKQCTYIARSPESYIEDAEQKIREAKKVLPELMALQKKTSEKPNILYFEGLTGMKQAYAYRLKEFHNKEIVGFFAGATDIEEDIHKEVFIPWNEYKQKHNMKIRGFTPDDKGLQQYSRFLSGEAKTITAKYLPTNLYDAHSSIEILDWGVRIAIMESKQVIIIESNKLARTLKQVFELLWQKTKGEYDEPQKLKLIK